MTKTREWLDAWTVCYAATMIARGPTGLDEWECERGADRADAMMVEWEKRAEGVAPGGMSNVLSEIAADLRKLTEPTVYSGAHAVVNNIAPVNLPACIVCGEPGERKHKDVGMLCGYHYSRAAADLGSGDAPMDSDSDVCECGKVR